MISVSDQEKSIVTIPEDIFKRLDPYHQALAKVLQDRGEVQIVNAAGGPNE